MTYIVVIYIRSSYIISLFSMMIYILYIEVFCSAETVYNLWKTDICIGNEIKTFKYQTVICNGWNMASNGQKCWFNNVKIQNFEKKF